MNTEDLKKACSLILKSIGEDPERDGLIKTPHRFAKMWKELASGYEAEKEIDNISTTFPGESYDEMVVVRDIDFSSLCEHHLLPFIGKASIGYIPNKKIIGISKLPRIVEVFARRLQNQERLVMQIADKIVEILEPKGVAVYITSFHTCMTIRGIKKLNSMTDTSSVRGIFRTDHRTRAEFFQMIRR